MITNPSTKSDSTNPSPANDTCQSPEDPQSVKNEFRQAILTGLSTKQKSIPCHFLYDARGSELFEQITRLPEYYPTRTEKRILKQVASQFLDEKETDVALVEFGSGSSEKTEIVLEELNEQISSYVAIEISSAALTEALDRISDRFPKVETIGIVENFHVHATLPDQLSQQHRLGFFPGSTIGNCTRQQAISLLSKMLTTLGEKARLIIGTDLIKAEETLVSAYDDSDGVTAEFSKNMLRRANRELSTQFNLEHFDHAAIWNEVESRIEIHLVSRQNQTVEVCGEDIQFSKGEKLHIEYSHKYSIESFHQLAQDAGWKIGNHWTDEKNWFAVHELVAPGEDLSGGV